MIRIFYFLERKYISDFAHLLFLKVTNKPSKHVSVQSYFT